MYERLGEEAVAAVKRRDYDAYEYAQVRMDALRDDSKEAIKFFERGGEPTIIERLHQTVDRILETRDNIADTMEAGIDIIADRHDEPLPKDGATFPWPDLNLFKNRR